MIRRVDCLRFSGWPIAVAMAVVIAGAGPDEAKKNQAKADPSAKHLADVEAKTEAEALTFVRENHAELATILAQLKAMKPDEYWKAVRELSNVSRRLAAIKERSPEEYAVDLDVWKAGSRVKLLAARIATATAAPPGPDMERQLRQTVEALVDAELRQQKTEKAAVEEHLRKSKDASEARIKKHQEAIDRLESKRDAVVEARVKSLMKKSQRDRRKPDADAGTKTKPKGERQP